MKKYGITSEQVMDKIRAQGGKCAICGTLNPGGRGQFAVDHNHATGQIRGMLCQSCNTGLGMFKEDKILMNKAIEYIDRF